MAFHDNNMGRYGEGLLADMDGYLPEAGLGDDSWDLDVDHGCERTHDAAPPAAFGPALRAARLRAGLSAAELAAAAGCARQHVYRLEAGEREPLVGLAWRLADALGVGLDELRPAR